MKLVNQIGSVLLFTMSGLTACHAQSTASAPVASKVEVNVGEHDRVRILKLADEALSQKPLTITSDVAKYSPGTPNDFYSNGDYWWPDPKKPDGLPYIQRDGETNPDNFVAHRLAMRTTKDAVAALAAAYKVSGDDKYVVKAAELLKVFFVDAKTRMNPHLAYTQAIPGRHNGSKTGVIDGLHLVEIPVAIKTLEKSKAFDAELAKSLHTWFDELHTWLLTHQHGIDEGMSNNNHAVAYFLQVAVLSDFVGDKEALAKCRTKFKDVFINVQMAADGSFPRETARTKPYAYSIFQLDNMVALCKVLSTSEENLWNYEGPEGRSIKKAVAWLYPYLADKSTWPKKPDVMAWDGWPSRQPSLLFAGLAYNESKYIELWKKLPTDPTNLEVRRNIAITQPVLWD
jgi:hypothetical protein